MSLKVANTVIANNAGVVPAAVIPDAPATMPQSISISASPGYGGMYRISISGRGVTIY